MLYLSLDTPPHAVFSVQNCGSALSNIYSLVPTEYMNLCTCFTVELLMKLEEESQLISHDLEDTAAKPSEATIELTKSLIDCIKNMLTVNILMPIY